MTQLKPDHRVVDDRTLFWNRVQLIMVLLVFLAPIIGAFWYMQYGVKRFNNYGEIYNPVRQIDNLTLQSGEQIIDFDSMRRQWVFLVVIADQCNEACEFNLLKIRQLKAMQNNDMRRIRTVFIYDDLEPMVAEDLHKKYQPIEGYKVATSDFNNWTKVLKRPKADDSTERNRIYIIDPAGNLMMSYPAESDPNLMKKDIKRLLKASQIG